MFNKSDNKKKKKNNELNKYKTTTYFRNMNENFKYNFPKYRMLNMDLDIFALYGIIIEIPCLMNYTGSREEDEVSGFFVLSHL